MTPDTDNRPQGGHASDDPKQVKRPSPFTGLALAALFALAVVAPATAQNGPPPGGSGGGPGGPPPDGGPGGMGQGDMAQGNRPGGGMNGVTLFVTGTVKATDATAETLTVTTQSGETGTVHVGPTAQITTQQTIKIADLKVGDLVAVQGVPTGLTASRLTAGQAPTGLPVMGGGPGGGPFGGRGDRRPGGDGQTGTGGAGADATRASASGTVKALPSQADPRLSLALGQDATLSVRVADGAEVTRYAALTLGGVKAGDQVTLAIHMGSDGTLTASAIGVNLSNGGPGRAPQRQVDAGSGQPVTAAAIP